MPGRLPGCPARLRDKKPDILRWCPGTSGFPCRLKRFAACRKGGVLCVRDKPGAAVAQGTLCRFCACRPVQKRFTARGAGLARAAAHRFMRQSLIHRGRRRIARRQRAPNKIEKIPPERIPKGSRPGGFCLEEETRADLFLFAARFRTAVGWHGAVRIIGVCAAVCFRLRPARRNFAAAARA